MRRSIIGGRFILVIAACAVSSCAPAVIKASPKPVTRPTAPLLQLWQNPADVAQRNLRWGPGGPGGAPPRASYTVLKKDETGYSPGYDVRGSDGREWSIKVGKEAQPEIVLSRILWALGYHQPYTYYVTGWRLTGDWKYEGEPARFRLMSDHENEGEWAWNDNPFVGSTPLHGLIAINMLLGNWDLKTSNNRIYRLADARAEPSGRYVVQDLGASLGKARVMPFGIGTRNEIDDFESAPFIREVSGSEAHLNYRGRHREIVERMNVADVIWACELMNRLRDAQFDDALQAAGYPPDIRRRYVTKIRSKIREGLALRPLVAARRGAVE